MKPASAALSAVIVAHERKVWAALAAGDAKADEALIADAFLGVYPSGFATRADHVGQLEAGPSVSFFELSEVTVRALAEDLALIAYRADFARTPSTAEREAMFVTSLWRRCAGEWINIFSQDTPQA